MKNKGFTMVELLSVIAILGILVTMAVAGVRGILNRTKESYLDGQNKMVVLAGKSYYADYQSHLPKVIGPIHEVTLETLVSLKYIDPVKDANGEDCVIAEGDKVSKVYVQKINEEEYKYSGYLYCNGEESGTNDTNPPTITISPMQTAVASKTALTVNIKVTDDIGVLSYRYVITKDGKEYKDTGYKNYKKQVSVKLNENGKYKIKTYAYDTSGNRGNKESGEYEVQMANANCNGITLTASPNSTAWQNKNISITLKKTDSSIESWTVKDSYYDNSSKKTTSKVLMKRTVKGQKSFTLSDNIKLL